MLRKCHEWHRGRLVQKISFEMEINSMQHFLTTQHFLSVSLRRALGDRRGISALEYGILAAVVVAAVAALSGSFSGLFTNLFSGLNNAVTSATST
jgi:Flp pilus assembly pilin Flp